MIVIIDLVELEEFDVNAESQELVCEEVDVKKLIAKTIEEQDEIELIYELRFEFDFAGFTLSEPTSWSEIDGKIYFRLDK